MTSQPDAYFTTPDRIYALAVAAERWTGTPFVANACIRGCGASCQKLAARLLIEAGHLPEDFVAPDGPMAWGRANKQSLIVPFLDSACRADGSHYFRAIDLREHGFATACGDLLGFRVGGCVQHLGVTIKVSPTFFMSALEDGAQLRRLDDATWLTRLEKIWRPME